MNLEELQHLQNTNTNTNDTNSSNNINTGNNSNNSTTTNTTTNTSTKNMIAYGIILKSVIDCPLKYYTNPYPDSNVNDNGDMLVLHFYDLAAKKKHILYTFEKVMINIEKE